MIEREPFFFIYVSFLTHFTILEWAAGLGLFWAEVPLPTATPHDFIAQYFV